jgi:hypothetical protein
MEKLKSTTLLLGIVVCGYILISTVGCQEKVLGPTIPFEESTLNLRTHKLQAYCYDQNTDYLVVFESGLGDDHGVWNVMDITGQVSSSADILLYDRGGYGKSGVPTNDRGIETLVDELAEVIEAHAHGRKIVLVGHSLGGMIIRDYAIKYPDQTAALLFVDSSYELYNNPSKEEEDEIYHAYKESKGADFGGTLESRQLVENVSYMTGLPHLPDVPVIAITSMKTDAQHTVADKQRWYDSKEKLREGVSDFTHVTTTKSGHYIQLYEPQLVIDNILVLLSKLQ